MYYHHSHQQVSVTVLFILNVAENSNNVIYLFKCRKCYFKFLYIGSTVSVSVLGFSSDLTTIKALIVSLEKN